MPSINLAPGTQYIIAARKRRARLYVIAGVIVLVFLLGWGGLFAYKQSLVQQQDKVQQEITNADGRIEELKEDAIRVTLFERRLTEVKKLLDSHITWAPVLSDLERLLPADTVLTNIDASSDSNVITLQGTTGQMDQVSLAIASLSAGQGHPSIFESGSVKVIQRQEQKNGDQVSFLYSIFLDRKSTRLNSSHT